MNWKKFIPDAIILAGFLALTFFLFAPLFSGQKLAQGDIIQYNGMASEYNEYLEKGEKIHWTNSAFSGMPTYLVASGVFKDSNLAQNINTWLRTIFPNPSGILFLCFLSFYLLSRALKTNKYLGAIGAIMFALGTFVLVSIEAGHNTKILAYAYSPMVLAGLIYAFRSNYFIGALLMALGLGGQIAANHIQITYYTFLICIFYGLYLLIKHIKSKNGGLIKAIAATTVGIVIAVGMNYNNLATTLEHSKETNRGGGSELNALTEGASQAEQAGSGLNYDYATQWSYKPLETTTLLIPRAMGGASGENLGEKSNLRKDKRIDKRQLEYVPTYWGEMPFTSGPIYLGALTVFLFLLSFFLLKTPFRWWMLGLTLLFILISWGKFSPGVYDLFFNNAPFFNKFRVPSMILLMLGLIFPLLGILGIDKLLKTETKSALVKPVLFALASTAGLVVLFGILGSGMYAFQSSQELAGGQMDRALKNLLVQDRKMVLFNDSLRSLAFILLGAGALYLFAKEKLKPWHLLTSLALLTLVDLIGVSSRYFNKSDFEFASNYERRMRASNADKQIQQDAALHYRVFNVSGSPFKEATTSLHHKSLGGYHAAILQRYMDVVDRQLRTGNEEVLDMLNAKYLIGQTQDGQPASQPRPTALGNAWLVDTLQFAKSADEEMAALSKLPLNSHAVVRASEKHNLANAYNGQGSVTLTKYHPEKMEYDANILGNEKAFVVFSEIYYAPKKGDGWQAYIGGEPVYHHRVNYTLRGLEIPAGKHSIKFVYTKKNFNKRAGIAKVSSGLLLLLILGSILYPIISRRKEEKADV